MKRITILLADDHHILREGLRMMLEFDDGVEVVGEAQDGRQAVAMAKLHQPDVVLMDVVMPVFNGLEATRRILAAVPETKVLVLSAYVETVLVKEAIEAGARGFLHKHTTFHELRRAIREVFNGETCFGVSFDGPTAHMRPPPKQTTETFNKSSVQLTAREMEVLQLIAQGQANKMIAPELGISIKTVEKHREHLMQKLDIHDTAGLTRYAIGAGMVANQLNVTIV